MPKSSGEQLDPLLDSAYDGAKYSIQLEPLTHKCQFTKIASNEIRCSCGKGYTGTNIDTLLGAFDNRF